jgi:hypothetical protein
MAVTLTRVDRQLGDVRALAHRRFWFYFGVVKLACRSLSAKLSRAANIAGWCFTAYSWTARGGTISVRPSSVSSYSTRGGIVGNWTVLAQDWLEPVGG